MLNRRTFFASLPLLAAIPFLSKIFTENEKKTFQPQHCDIKMAHQCTTIHTNKGYPSKWGDFIIYNIEA